MNRVPLGIDDRGGAEEAGDEVGVAVAEDGCSSVPLMAMGAVEGDSDESLRMISTNRMLTGNSISRHA